jgi:hypothetical protein
VAEALRDAERQRPEGAGGKVHALRVPWVEVQGPRPLQINRDGEPTASADKWVDCLALLAGC